MKGRIPFGLAVILIFCLFTSITLFEQIYQQHEKSKALQKSTKRSLESRIDPEQSGDFFSTLYSAFKNTNPDEALDKRYLPDLHSSGKLYNHMISIHIIAFNRPRSLKTLLQQLDQAHYDQATYGAIDLYVRIDYGAPEQVKSIANGFKWSKGWKYVVFSPAPMGVRGMWTSIEPRSPHEVLLIFEDDTRVSPYCLIWTLHLLERYGGYGSAERDPSIFGLSLSPLRLDEISYPFRPWNASKFLADDQHAFLHSVPSSWGAVMFGDRWQQFLDFFAARTTDALYNVSAEPKLAQGPDAPTLGDPGLAVPGSRSNVWPKSWKRFLIDYCFGRGLVTLYTHVPGYDDLGMATTLQLSGEHVISSANASLRIPNDYGGLHPTAAMHRNPRVGRLLDLDNGTDAWDTLRRGRPPPVAAAAPAAAAGDDLPVFDLWGRPTTRGRLARQGRNFLTRIWARDPRKYSPVLRAWLGQPPPAGGGGDVLADEAAWRAALRAVWPGAEAPAAGEREWPRRGRRFLVYQPQFGFSNQRIALRNAAYWAGCLNRTLVVPPAFIPRVSGDLAAAAGGVDARGGDWGGGGGGEEDGAQALLGRLVAMDQLFDLEGVNMSWCRARLRTESLARFMARGLRPEQVLAAHPTMQADQLSDRFFDDILGWGAVPRVRGHADLCSDKLPRSLLLEELGTVEDRVLAVDGLFRCGPGDRGVNRDAMLLRLQRPSPPVAAALRKVAGVLEGEGYAVRQEGCKCLQVRLGDFHNMCALDIPWMAKHRSRGLQCIVNASRLQAEVRAWPGACVQLLTNDEAAALAMVADGGDPAVAAPSPSGKAFLVQSAIMAALKEVGSSLPPPLRLSQASEALSIIAEEHMCQQAPEAVLNGYSSLGATVSLLRAHRNASTRFW